MVNGFKRSQVIYWTQKGLTDRPIDLMLKKFWKKRYAIVFNK